MMLSALASIVTVTVVVPVLLVKVRRGWLDEVVGEVVRRSMYAVTGSGGWLGMVGREDGCAAHHLYCLSPTDN